MPPLIEEKNGRTFWRSLEERADAPEFRHWVEAEFPSQAPKFLDPVSRRRFLKVMGASMALLGLAGCRWPEEEIVPYASRPEGMTPGVAKLFASAYEIDGVGHPVLATSFDGRPIKVDGNPEHPMSLGASTALTQASVLELYDPDRSSVPMNGEMASSWNAFEAFARGLFDPAKATGGAGIAVLAEPSGSPTLGRMHDRFQTAFPNSRWHVYAPFAGSTGTARALPNLANADVILCLDDDLLGDHPGSVHNTRGFSERRRVEGGTMSRLYVAESAMTVTGGVADHRFPIRAGEIPIAARGIAAAIGVPGLNGGDAAVPAWVDGVAEDLRKAGKRALVTASPRQNARVHDLVRAINEKLGSAGNTVEYRAAPDEAPGIEELAKDLESGSVSTLIILGGNPVFDAPPALSFANAMKKADTTIHLGLYVDETAAACTWHLPRAHWLESWGDVTALDGTLSVTQPLIRALYGGKTAPELIAAILGEPETKGHEIVRRTWTGALGEDGFEKRWRKVLHDGLFAVPARPATTRPSTAGYGEWLASLKAPSGMELVVRSDPKIRDGRFANSGWLQELPDPVTKLTWDNAAMLSPEDAGRIGVEDGDHVKIAAGAAAVVIPVFVQPGQAVGSVTMNAGYGRKRGGRVADGAGVDVYPLLGATDASITKVAGHTRMASTMNHHAIDTVGQEAIEHRLPELIREATLEEYEKDPEFAKHVVHHPPLLSLWKEHQYDGRRWGMMIDLSSCTGCSACVVACQSENNVPVVGKDEVLMGRDMHWLRVDRYYSGEPEAPSVRHQPIPCMQCENAPCEQVCPVAATVHSDEGLNDMVYNRCIGTRYCSNNCPYKVRRFNWFKNHDGLTDIQKMKFNPEVTVRARGVMEKCTYCVQRISAARITAKNEGRAVRDGEAVTACAQACPANAITFGDLADPESRVAKAAASPRAYALLEELNVKPRTRYLARITNPRAETE